MSKQVVFKHPQDSNKGISVWKDKDGQVVVSTGSATLYERENALEVATYVDTFKVNRNFLEVR